MPLRVAVMGCVVNGPGEAREADLGVASGNGKGQIFVKGEVIKTVPESQIVETLIEEAARIAEDMGIDLEPTDLAPRSPSPDRWPVGAAASERPQPSGDRHRPYGPGGAEVLAVANSQTPQSRTWSSAPSCSIVLLS